MGLRYVPVPYEALELVPRKYWAPVTDLYRRGHTLRWREFGSSEKSLATSWNISRRQVRSILDALHSLGLITVRPGSRGVPTRIHVHDPATLFCGPVGEPVPGPSSDQADADNRRSEPESVPVPGPEGEPVPVQTLSDPDMTTDQDPDIEEEQQALPGLPALPKLGKETSDQRWERVCQTWDHHAGHEEGRTDKRWQRSRGLGKELHKLGEKKPEDLERVLRWLREAEDTKWRRDKGWHVKVKTVRAKFDEYNDLAKVWEDEGAPKLRERGQHPAAHRERDTAKADRLLDLLRGDGEDTQEEGR